MTQHYVGTKIIEAWPAEKDGQPGYGVKYPDGYISWSPAAVFEAAYLPIGSLGNLPPHVQRMIAEAAELASKYAKLDDFVNERNTSAFAELAMLEQDLLVAQGQAMGTYLNILRARIAMATGAEVPLSGPSPAPRYRCAETGEYVTEGYAEANPATTVKESS